MPSLSLSFQFVYFICEKGHISWIETAWCYIICLFSNKLPNSFKRLNKVNKVYIYQDYFCSFYYVHCIRSFFKIYYMDIQLHIFNAKFWIRITILIFTIFTKECTLYLFLGHRKKCLANMYQKYHLNNTNSQSKAIIVVHWVHYRRKHVVLFSYLLRYYAILSRINVQPLHIKAKHSHVTT